MKVKTKLLTYAGAMLLLTTAILPSSAMAKATTNYTRDPFSFHANQYSALLWCEKGMKENGANCCSKDSNNLGHPGYLSTYHNSPDRNDWSYECDLL